MTPHVVCHSTACGLLASEVDRNTIRTIPGHASLDTINIYAEIDIGAKAGAMELCEAAEPGTNCLWKQDKGVMAFLKGLWQAGFMLRRASLCHLRPAVVRRIIPGRFNDARATEFACRLVHAGVPPTMGACAAPVPAPSAEGAWRLVD